MPDDAAPDRRPEPEPDGTAEQYLQRAMLLADLGRYDEAAGELVAGLAVAPADPRLPATLARVHLASAQPEAALAAADRALAVEPGSPEALVVRGLALVDLRRFAEAAQVAGELLQRRPDDPYALRSAAGILSESRNGQPALNAAWRAVELVPDEPQGHLVLGVVAARLRLFDLAERAYREALRLDPELAEAQRDVGIVRLERRRYAEALEHLAEAAVGQPSTAQPTESAGAAAPPVEVVPAEQSRLPTADGLGEAVRRLVLYGAGHTLVAALTAAFMALVSTGASRAWAGLMALIGGLVLWLLVSRLPTPVRQALRTVAAEDRRLPVAGYATLAGPVLILAYAVVGGPWPLVLAIAAGGVAEFAVLVPRRD